MPAADAALCCGGFYLDHPATAGATAAARGGAASRLLVELAAAELFAPPATFLRLDAAMRFAAAHRPEAGMVHGIWLAEPRARAMLREEAPAPPAEMPAVLRSLRRGAVALPPCAARGWDVLGFAGERCWSWHAEPAALEALAAGGEAPMAHDLLPTAAVARRLVRALEAELLGAPVLWRSWQRTVHAVRGG